MKRFIAVILLFAMMIAVIPAAHADLMTDARSMLQMINEFRTGDNAWYWNRDNTSVTRKSGLGRLQYDEELEAVALVRANELAIRFDHTRPDGTDCFTAFPDNRDYVGENIACGYRTAAEAFEGFLEEDEDYAGQGHRRIMLMGEMTRVGIAAVEVNGTRYWVQEFASAPMEAPLASTGTAGLEQRGGKWSYRKADGSVVIGWMKENGNWYYMDRDGIMHTGWLQDGGAWYYMNAAGIMQTGWISDGGAWYYMESSGAMATGWVSDGGVWYYMKPSGAMATGWVSDGGSWYYMKPSGAMATGWVTDGGSWYYMSGSGAMATGWISDGGSWYYMSSSGAMLTGWITDGSTWYYMKPSGAMQTGWFEDKEAESRLPADKKRAIWYWFDNNGTMAIGWKPINNQWEMFADSGEWLYTYDGK